MDRGQTGGIVPYQSTGIAAYSQEAQLMARFRHDAVEDQCTALLAKNSMGNAAMLVSYAKQLGTVNPEGAEIYAALTKCYVVSAGKRIMGGDC